MQDQSSILSLPFILPSQAQKHVTHNEALGILDILVQLSVSDRTLNAPPANPAEGERHIVANGAVGDWAGAERQIATWTDGNWRFIEPQPGWRAEVLSEERSVVFDGTAWVERLPDLDNLAGVGVGTTADAVNRLAVASPATLLTHEGAGHQLKLNKAAQGDTASLLFQTNWSGRAEMGTAGADDWSIKVSADGATWTEALRVAGASGLVSGAAVQSSATDTTAGRLMRADFGYSRGNILGTVAQSGGVPTGAIIERGSNANGSYTRFADGTQICTFEGPEFTTTVAAGAVFQEGNNYVWSYPASFFSDPYVAGSGGGTSRWIGLNNPGLGAVGYRIYSWVSNANLGAPQMIAIGRWF